MSVSDHSLIHIGTSGWNYAHWLGTFYPEGTDQHSQLIYYSRQFRTVEVNNTFYNLPAIDTIKHWIDIVPENFLFSVKASRYITHMKKLKDPAVSLSKFISRMVYFRDKMGPILFQLPPNWKFNYERLKNFISRLPDDYTYTFEFRDHRWMNEEAIGLLHDNNIALCIYDLAGYESPKKCTSDIVYIRLHGSTGPYEGKYPDKILMKWAKDIIKWENQGKEVYCYFNNDAHGFATMNAKALKEFISKAL